MPAVISIPIIVLHKVRISPHQKFALGAFLCLSVCMIAIAIIRVAGVVMGEQLIDMQWEVFWGAIESDIAVIVVSITAFRSLLGMKHSQNRDQKQRAWYTSRLKQGFWKKVSTESSLDTMKELPQIPGATMTGVRTYIRGAGQTMQSSGSDTLYEECESVKGVPGVKDALPIEASMPGPHYRYCWYGLPMHWDVNQRC